MLEPLTNHVHLIAQWMRPPRASNRLTDRQPGETRKSAVMSQEQTTPPYFGEGFIEAGL
jgi:hypothetical protein